MRDVKIAQIPQIDIDPVTLDIIESALKNYRYEMDAVLYRTARLGNKIANALKIANIPFVRSDGNALVRRNSRLARFIECARWATGGWREGDPPFARLLRQALSLVFGHLVRDAEEQLVSAQLIALLERSVGSSEMVHIWHQRFPT
jgi:DNA helicase-2/ATP-dependent DNA helicase PcrA